MAPTRLLLTGDILRPLEHSPQESESVRRIRWFEDLLVPPISLVTDLPVQRLACEGALTLSSLYADAGRTPSLDAWADLFAGDLGDTLEARLLEACRDAVVIGIELPPSVARALHRGGVPVIDASVDPHRFLYDIPLAWRSTVPAASKALAPFGETAFDIRRRAAQIRAKARWIAPLDIPEGATLILDQVATDSAMIDPLRRRRVAWSDYLEPLQHLQDLGPMLWRPHPNNQFHQIVGVLEDLLGEQTKTHANFYQLLSHDHLARVVAISSGGVIEARAFGKEGLHFLDRYAGIDLGGWETPVPVVGHWLSPHFWSAVLAPLTPTRTDVPTLAVEKDFVRRSTNWDWGFGWIDQIVIR